MELRRHIAVAWRWKLVMVFGFACGILLAILAAYSVTLKHGLSMQPRGQQEWTSHSTLFVTQAGFPWGRVVLDSGAAGGVATTGTAQKGGQYAQPSRFGDLAVLYSYIGQSEQVRQLINPRPLAKQISIVPPLNGDTVLPLLNVDTNSPVPGGAELLNRKTVDALKGYLAEQQSGAGISSDARVQIQVLNPPSKAFLTKGRSKLGPMLAFILCILVSLGLSYLLENLYPRLGPIESTEATAADEPDSPSLRLAGSRR